MSYVTWPDIDVNLSRRGIDEVELDNGDILLWPKCEITNCPNNVCIHMSKSLCYPHGIEFKAFTVEEFEANRKARHA